MRAAVASARGVKLTYISPCVVLLCSRRCGEHANKSLSLAQPSYIRHSLLGDSESRVCVCMWIEQKIRRLDGPRPRTLVSVGGCSQQRNECFAKSDAPRINQLNLFRPNQVGCRRCCCCCCSWCGCCLRREQPLSCAHYGGAVRQEKSKL